MEEASVAFCPGHISGYFCPVRGPDLTTTGSIGAGLVISEGVTSSVCSAGRSRADIVRTSFQGEVIERIRGSPPIERAMDRLGVEARVETRCRLPLSAGFGLSAAALISTISALNDYFSLGMTTLECYALAHETEVTGMTGLGDVAACQGGGIDCRKGAGISGGIIRLPPPPMPVYAVTFGPLPSPGVLGSGTAMDQVARAFPARCPASIDEFLALSRKFVEDSGLITPDVRMALALCDRERIAASMTMIGNGIFAYGTQAGTILSGFGEVFELRVAPVSSECTCIRYRISGDPGGMTMGAIPLPPDGGRRDS
jgi:pantoate kinase